MKTSPGRTHWFKRHKAKTLWKTFTALGVHVSTSPEDRGTCTRMVQEHSSALLSGDCRKLHKIPADRVIYIQSYC